MTDAKQTTTPATQAFLPVTPEDIEIVAQIFEAERNKAAAWAVRSAGLCGTVHHDVAQVVAQYRAACQAHSLPGDVGTALKEATWLNLMPREIVARAALNEGCRDKTADDIRSGLHGDVKIRAEVAVKLVGFIQEQCFAALTPSALSGDAEARALEACPILDSERTDRDVGLARGSWRRGYKAAHQGAGG